ncbi:myelin-oligodendrocyte glycoprotein-like isoform X2 [Meleagris gallopavo]|uniref:myelin-oligodendrocyte glycoprotein-like isoform X2 n=1 Tax=Meleagris gallopavo TaxID=9103 RepID=UPI00093E086B|nr:myelin-oligodendrocyte glycoprotein-like isoform X2 [Meleagris gallopavo]
MEHTPTHPVPLHAPHSHSHHLTVSPCPSHCPAQLRVVAPSLRVTAIVGQDVVLRCHLCPCKDAWNSDIRWIQHQSSGFVHHYQNGVDLEQMEEYKGRTELLRNGLSDGNLDLRITAVRSTDSGSYSCAVENGDGYAEAVVNLEVSDPFSETIYPWKVALGVVVPLLLVAFVVIIAFLYRKQAAQIRELMRRSTMLEELLLEAVRRDAHMKDIVAKLGNLHEKMERMDAKLEKQDAALGGQREESEKHGQETVVGTEESEKPSEEQD